MTKALVCAAALTAAGVLLWDPRVRTQERDAAPVLAAVHEALGGDQRLDGVKSFLATGRIRQVRGDNLIPVEFEIACELPDRYVRRDEFPAQDAPPIVNGFRGNEQIGSSKTTRDDFLRLMLGAFAGAPPGLSLTFSYGAEAEAPEGKADVLNVTGPANFSARFVIQRATHMPVMLMWEAPGPAGRGAPSAPGIGAGRGAAPPGVEHRLFYADYRAVNGGVQWPYRIRHAVAGTTIEETTFDRVTINAKIDPKKFAALK